MLCLYRQLVVFAIQISLWLRFLVVIVENSKTEIEATQWLMLLADYKTFVRVSITMYGKCILWVLAVELAIVSRKLSP